MSEDKLIKGEATAKIRKTNVDNDTQIKMEEKCKMINKNPLKNRKNSFDDDENGNGKKNKYILTIFIQNK